jgi:hypothetical protein
MACFYGCSFCVDLCSLMSVTFAEESHDIETLFFFLEDSCLARRLTAGERRPLNYLLHGDWQLDVVNWTLCN